MLKLKNNEIIPYSFILKRKVTPTNATAIEYSFEYKGDELFLERCINVAKHYEYKIKIGYYHNIFNFLQPKDVRHYYVAINRAMDVHSIDTLDFHSFLEGKSISFAKPKTALIFEKLASKSIEDWLSKQYIEFKDVQGISQ